MGDGSLMAGLMWLARWMSEKRGLRVELDSNCREFPLTEDAKILLFESVRELLLNAAQHADVRTARVSLRRIGDRALQVSVSDMGRGFDVERLPWTGEYGTGLGLYGIREQLHHVGGSLDIVSAPLEGSRFTLQVPLDPTTDDAPAEEPESGAAPAELGTSAPAKAPESGPALPRGDEPPIRVLLVDDQAVLRQGLSLILRQEPDIQVVGEAEDGQAAVDWVREVRPDVVLMDVSMPRMNGVDATAIIHTEWPEVSVIGLSMHADRGLARAMLAAGAVAYLTKMDAVDTVVAEIRARGHHAGSAPAAD